MDGWKYLVVLVIVFLLLIALTDCEAKGYTPANKHPVYHRLIFLQPNLDKDLAMSISDEIYKCHKRTGIDKFIMTAIYNQESSINYKAKNCLKGILENGALDEIIGIVKSNTHLLFNEKRLREDLTHIPLKVCFDLGIGQINVNTALRHPQCKDLQRLLTDHIYNISCSCEVLASFKKKYGKKEKNWWTRYNASNPEKREIYRQLVMRYYPKLKKEDINEDITQSEKKIR